MSSEERWIVCYCGREIEFHQRTCGQPACKERQAEYDRDMQELADVLAAALAKHKGDRS